MFLTRLHRRFTAWVALVALVLGALAPTVTQARLAGGERGDWMQICSVSGMVWVQADTGAQSEQVSAGSTDDGLPAGKTIQHCAWCTLHGGAAGLPPAPLPVVLSPEPADQPPVLRAVRLAGLGWASPPSRGPPASF